ncbi:MAG: adenylate/guanylate cyclase domain-containing protein [Allomuricauda sp.]
MLPLIIMFHPKYIRYAKQALLFACIWFLFGLVYSIIEQGILGRLEYYPTTHNKYDFKSSLIYASVGGFLTGLIHGWIEVTWLSKKLAKSRLWTKISIKTSFYTGFIILFLIMLSFAVNSRRFDAPILSQEVIQSVEFFVGRYTFWSVVVYIAFALLIAMLFAELSIYVGTGVFLNFLFGKYHTPKRESRIFMFLDMKSSTTIAEQLGHAKFFELLKDYYADMANPILETSGEIYQYVGDEIVITWPEKMGLYKNNCIECFLRISKTLEQKKARYEKKFNFFPSFKAGYHVGLVTTGEIGVIKKEIIYTGDVLNTAARIQDQCNNYGTKILVSEQLRDKLKETESMEFWEIAKLQLRGKKEQIRLFALNGF